ncbi:unnamed protein product [Camellia sinensis]
MSSPDINGMMDNSKELDRLRKEQEDVLSEINKMHKKLQTTPEVVEKPGDNSLARLKMLYTQAKELSDSELTWCFESVISATGCSDAFWTSRATTKKDRCNEQKKKRMKADSDISRPTPSVRNHLDALASLKGEQVAARVTQENAEKDEWFVVKVIHFDRETREFEVLDEEPGDDEEGGGQRKYKLPWSHIIPFPKRNDPSGAQDFPTGKQVLAVYPSTTALYKATVVQPRKRKADDYVLEFDDDEEEDGSLPQRIVPFHRVVGLPEGHRQGQIDKEELLELVELEVPKLLSSYEFPGDDVLIVSGSALLALDALMAQDSGYWEERLELQLLLGLRCFQKILDEALAGDNAGLFLRGIQKVDVKRGMVLAKLGMITLRTKFVAIVYLLKKEEGGRHSPFLVGYRPQFYMRTTDVARRMVSIMNDKEEESMMVMPGDHVKMVVELIMPAAYEQGMRFAIREGGKTVGAGVIQSIVE